MSHALIFLVFEFKDKYNILAVLEFLNMNNRKIAILSDLHLDVANYTPPSLDDVDLIVLPGDVCEVAAGSPVEWMKKKLPSHVPVIFVPGNHDFYGGRVGNLLNIWRKQAKFSNIHVLYNDVYDWEGIPVLGSTLWSGLALNGNPVNQAHLRRTLPMNIADFSCIYQSGGKSWTVGAMLKEHEKCLRFLDKNIPKNSDSLVLTHFAPHKNSLHPRFEGDAYSPYFINHLPELVERSSLWIHGHTHDFFNYNAGKKPGKGDVVCHPRGYPHEFKNLPPYEPMIINFPPSPKPSFSL